MRYPNLDTAIEYCRKLAIKFEYKMTNEKHFKFYVNGSKQYILLSSKKHNPDRVIKDIRRMINEPTSSRY